MTKFNDKDEPERIYIQEWGSGGDTTWCSDRINDADDDCPDIEYVHIDIMNALLEALESVEWVSGFSNGDYCLFCHGLYPDHETYCNRQAAIAKAKVE